MFGCSWKIVSAKFQQINTSKLTFVQDSDDDNGEGGDDDEDDISVDNDVIAKISQPQKKTLVEKEKPTPVAPVPVVASKPVHKPIPQEEEDDEDDEAEEADDDEINAELENVNEEDEDDAEDSDEEEVKVVPAVEPVKPVVVAETKPKKAVAKKAK
jgi:hypothetical protein